MFYSSHGDMCVWVMDNGVHVELKCFVGKCTDSDNWFAFNYGCCIGENYASCEEAQIACETHLKELESN